MADNVIIPASGTGDATPVVATDEVGGAHYQRMKLDGGGNGVSVPIVAGQQTMSASVPVVIASNQAAIPVTATFSPSGTQNVDPVANTIGLATGAKQDTGNTSLGTIATEVAGLLTDTELRATPVPVSGTVTTGGLTDTQLRATPVPVSAASLPLPTGAATLAEQQTQTASLSVLDDWDESDRAKVNVIVGQAGIAGGTGVDGATVPRVTLATNVPLPAGTNGIGKLTANTGVTIGAVEIAAAQTLATVTTVSTVSSVTAIANALPAGNNNIGDVDIASIAAGNNNIGDVDVASIAAGNNNIGDVDIASVTWAGQAVIGGGVNGSVAIGGNVAHDGADAANPVGMGGKAVAFGANPTGVTAGDRTYLYANRAGVPFTIGGHPNIITIEAAYAAASPPTNAAIVTVSSGTKIVVTQIQVVASAANTVGAGFRVGFATATTPTTTGVVLTHPQLVPGSGVSRGDGSGILGVGADDEDLRITADDPVGGSIRVLVSYFTIES